MMLAARLVCLRTLPPRAFRPGLSTKAAPVLRGPIRKDPWPLAPSRVKITWMPGGLALCSPISHLLEQLALKMSQISSFSPLVLYLSVPSSSRVKEKRNWNFSVFYSSWFLIKITSEG